MPTRVSERITISGNTGQAVTAAQRLEQAVAGGFDRMARAVESARSPWTRFQAQMVTVDAAMGVVSRTLGVVRSAIGGVSSGLQQAATQTTGINRMVRSFQNVEGGATRAAAAMEALASSQQDATRFGDDVTRAVGAEFATAMGDATVSVQMLTEATRLAEDLMEDTGKTAQEAGLIVARAYAGNVEAVGRMIPALRDEFRELARNADQSERAAAAVRALENAYGGAAASIDPVDQAMANLSNTAGDLSEAFFEQLGAALESSGAMDTLIEVMRDMIEVIPRLEPLFSLVGSAIGLAADAAGLFATALNGVATAVSKVMEEFRPYMALREREAQLDADLRERTARAEQTRREPDELIRTREEIANAEAAIERDRAALEGLGTSRSAESERRMRVSSIRINERLLPDLRRREARLAREFERAGVASGEAFGSGMEVTGNNSVPPPSGGSGGGGSASTGDLASALAAASSALGVAAEAAGASAIELKPKFGASGGAPASNEAVFGAASALAGRFGGGLSAAAGGLLSAGSSIADAAAADADAAIEKYSTILDGVQTIGDGLVEIMRKAGGQAGAAFVEQVGSALDGLRSAVSFAESIATGNVVGIFGGFLGMLTGLLGALGVGGGGGGGGSPRPAPRRSEALVGLEASRNVDQTGVTQHFHIGYMFDSDQSRQWVASKANEANRLGELRVR